ncbi:MAG TPA: universal stress protein [Nitrospiria bacterium]|nr:universal stress protein [Nitrospiria bacterium]
MPTAKATPFAVKTILVPTDFSEGSQAALDYAVNLAKSFGSKIVLLHVIETTTYTMTEALQLVNVYEVVRTAVEPVLDQMVTDLQQQKLSVSRAVAQGASAHEIVSQAREVGADLIVMGTHGRRGVNHLMVGSVAERVVRTAACPVLTVRQPVTGAGQTK